MQNVQILIKRDGTAEFLDGDAPALLAEGTATTRRASHVVPAGAFKRAAFRLLRCLFGERGRVAEYTRSWSGEWIVDMRPSSGPARLGTYKLRADALAAERAWLEQKLFGGEHEHSDK